jgi:hypothetical protein
MISFNLSPESILEQQTDDCYAVDINFVDPYLVEQAT